jgi:hypothetical protein
MAIPWWESFLAVPRFSPARLYSRELAIIPYSKIDVAFDYLTLWVGTLKTQTNADF